MTRARALTVAAVVLLVALVAVVVLWQRHEHRDPYADYCSAVKEHRALVSAAMEKGAATGLIAALPSFKALRAEAPSDIADDWRKVVAAITALVDVLHQAGVDPSSYDHDHPPAGVSTADQGRIDTAATRLGSAETRSALTAVDQEARDVCHTPLMM